MERSIQPPDYAGLINPITCQAFPLRYDRRDDVIRQVTVGTGPESLRDPLDIVALDQTIQCTPAEALLCVAPFVKVTRPLPASYAGRLMTARISFDIDGEFIVRDEPLERFLVAPACRLDPRPDADDPLVIVGRDEADLLGACMVHFAPDKSRLRVMVSGVPAGAGRLDLVAGVLAARYTTKARQGCLFDFGTLDDSQNCYPSLYGWRQANPKTVTSLKIEEAHAAALAARLREAEDKIRRFQEDADLREKLRNTAARRKLAEIQERISRPPPCKPPLTPMPTSAVPPPPAAQVDFEAGLARAKRRLITWGVVATGVFVTAAIVVGLLVRMGMIQR